MNKRIVAIVLLSTVLVLSLNSTAYAGNAARKLGRGVTNIITGWLEIPAEVGRKTAEDGDLAGVLVAPFTGILKAAGRMLGGIYDVVTFAIPIPCGYEPLVEPEFVMGNED